MDHLDRLNRRCFLGASGIALGRMALTSLLQAESTPSRRLDFPARAKSIIYLFMEGGPSQLDLFVDKPKLKAMHGQPMPQSMIAGKKFAFMETMGAPKICGPAAEFARHGQSGNVISTRLP